MKKKSNTLRDILCLVIILNILMVLFRFVYFNEYIPSESMLPTLQVDDQILGQRWNLDKIERYDIVSFYAPDEPDTIYIKRVIGLPGDVIDIKKDGHVYINGECSREDFILEKMEINEDKSYTVPEGHYFVMGDNRNESYDSRYWENTYVPQDNIVSKNGVIYWPLNHISFVK